MDEEHEGTLFPSDLHNSLQHASVYRGESVLTFDFTYYPVDRIDDRILCVLSDRTSRPTSTGIDSDARAI